MRYIYIHREQNTVNIRCGVSDMVYIYSEAERDFYGSKLIELLYAQQYTLDLIDKYREEQKQDGRYDPIDHCKSRIKSAASMRSKLERYNLPQTSEAALNILSDAVGIRIICGFIDDVYAVAQWLQQESGLSIEKVKDYISYPKPNGYRSYHVIVKTDTHFPEAVCVEIQIRTIAQDCWASLEHQMKYKHSIPNKNLIVNELKRCANEIAATDISMQTIRELIQESNNSTSFSK